MLKDRLKIIVGVYIVRGPMGGMSWHYLQYAAGLAQMGHDVTIIEDSDDHEWTCYDPTTGLLGTDPTFGLRYLTRALDRFGLGEHWSYYDAHGGGWTGPAAARIEQTLRDADVYVNVSGANVLRPWLHSVPRRVFVDTDPGFVQIRNLSDHARREATAGHNVFLSFGERIGAVDCLIPNDGFPWRPTRQPVILDAWSMTPPPPGAPFTTLMKWDSYRSVSYDGLELGMKSESFMSILDLPSAVGVPLEIAIGSPCPAKLLTEHGWLLRDPDAVAHDPWAFREYVAASAAELTVAKHGYVATRSGWFSERSANYLASGRPVITQETGFSDVLPTGAGLLSFRDRDEALAALADVVAHPARHASAARALAAEHFDARNVLTQLLRDTFA